MEQALRRTIHFPPAVYLPPPRARTHDTTESAAFRALKSQPGSILIGVSDTEMDAFHF